MTTVSNGQQKVLIRIAISTSQMSALYLYSECSLTSISFALKMQTPQFQNPMRNANLWGYTWHHFWKMSKTPANHNILYL